MTRFRIPKLRRAEWLAFGIALALGLIGLFPLALALPLLGLSDQGLNARSASGSIWSGRLADATFGPVALGDVGVRLQLFPLLVGRARVDLSGAAGTGGVSVSPGSRGIDDVTAILQPTAALAGLQLDRLAFEDFSAGFSGDRCLRAEGRVRLTFAGSVAGLTLPGGVSGVGRCEGTDLVLPLTSQSGLETLTLRIGGDGRYRGRFAVRSVDPALVQALTANGFTTAGGVSTLVLAGRL